MKSISNNFEKEGHIKDLIISKDHRYKGLDQSLKDALLVIAFQIELVTLLYDDSNKETKKQPLYFIKQKKIFNYFSSKNDFLNSDNNLNYTEGPKESRLNNHKNNVFFLTSFLRYDSSINSEKLLLLSADEVGNIHIFDVKTKLLEKSFKLDKKYEKFKNILYIEESKYLSSSLLITSENLLILIDWENGHVIDTFDCKDNINHVIYLPEFNEMSGALTVTNKLIKVMKLDSNKECNIQEIKADKMVSSLVAVKEKIQNFYTFFAGIENGNIIHFDILKNDSNDQILKIFKHCEDDHNIIGIIYLMFLNRFYFIFC